MTQYFTSVESFKMALTVVVDNQAKEYNYIREDMGSGWMPCVGAGSWTENYDVEEDGDGLGVLHLTRYCFEGKSPLAVRREVLTFAQGLAERLNLKRNEKLYL